MCDTLKILTIVGARPQFIKAAMVSRAIMAHNQGLGPLPIAHSPSPIIEEILHTGQHYDANMSDIFFQEMGIPAPAVNLNISGGSHGEMTGKMLAAIESEIISRRPDWVLVYGDTNSTLAGALAAAKLHVPVAHVESGLRSFNRRMPEEINRVLTDHLSTLLFCPTHAAVQNLLKEGFPPATPIANSPQPTAHRPSPIAPRVFHVGDVMYDAALVFGDLAGRRSTILHDLDLMAREYLLVTVHRAENTNDPARLQNILKALLELSRTWTIVFPVHPRTRAKMNISGRQSEFQHLQFVPPVSFLDMVQLEKNARCILTDSGGVQKEAYFHGVPCVTVRDETEWVETVAAGWNQVVGTNADSICEAATRAVAGLSIPEYGNGHASEAIVNIVTKLTDSIST